MVVSFCRKSFPLKPAGHVHVEFTFVFNIVIPARWNVDNIIFLQVRNNRMCSFKLPELPFQNELTKSIAVTQRIRCMDEDAVGDAKVIDRVDNVIEFTPFADTVGDLLGDSMPFAALKDLTLNPLEVKKSKVTLVHKAEVQSVAPVLRTKINLQSYVRE